MPDVMDWLLEEDNPPVRWLTLTGLLGSAPASAEARKTRARMMEYGPTKRILAQAGEFLDDGEEAAYAKYTGLYWQAIFFGWFLADGKEPAVARLCGRLMERRDWVRKVGMQCLTANILAALMRMGYADHPAVREEREALAARIVRGGGLDCRAMEYSLLTRCHMAQPKVLLCLAQVPPASRSKAEREAIDIIVRRILADEVFVYVPERRKEWAEVLARKPGKEQRGAGGTSAGWIAEQKKKFLAETGPGGREPKAGWLKFGFPLSYNSDVLEALCALALAGTPADARLSKALEAVEAKRTGKGVWLMENSLNGKMRSDVEAKGKPSKWLTFLALRVLRHFGA
jgi:hypothetical protein